MFQACLKLFNLINYQKEEKMSSFRIEHDSLGEMQVPAHKYYGVQTMRAIENSSISGQTIDDYPEFIHGIAAIKKAAAIANHTSKAFSKEICDAICQATAEIMEDKHKGEFPIDILQGGGGTPANMNLNEVIANRANEIISGKKGYDLVHPNTHVNMSQSTNDVIPSSMKIACYKYLGRVSSSLETLESAFRQKAEEFKDVVKMGRTCIQDALPITLGQEFGGYAAVIARRREIILDLQKKCTSLPLGATAIGTKMGTRLGYIQNVYPALSETLGYEVKIDDNLFDALQNADAYSDISSGLKGVAISISKIAQDLRMFSSGPHVGLGEINLPPVQPGSSIMPGKYNPVMPELVIQVAQVVCGNDYAVCMATEAGELDLNVWELTIIKSIAESSKLLAGAMELFAKKCILGITANKEFCYESSSNSLALSTVIAALIDYPTGSFIAKKAMEHKISIKEACLREGLLTQEQADVLLDPLLLTDGELFAAKIEEYKDIVNKR